jgi:hypothetical protein
MILTTLSALNLCQDCKEIFTIQAGKHQSIYITFIYWNTIRLCEDLILNGKYIQILPTSDIFLFYSLYNVIFTDFLCNIM